MLGYVTLGTNDLPRAAAFYDALLAEIGAKRLMDYGRGYSYGESMAKPFLYLGDNVINGLNLLRAATEHAAGGQAEPAARRPGAGLAVRS